MQIAKPASEEKVRELANKLAHMEPSIFVDSFLLPRNEECNSVWNIVSTRSFAPLFEWYLFEKNLADTKRQFQESALAELLEGIVDSPKHMVVINGRMIPITIAYLRKTDNWMSNYTAISILEALSRKLGPQYADENLGFSPANPWLAATKHILEPSTVGMGLVQQLVALRDGPRAVYRDLPRTAAFFNRASIYEVISELQLSVRRRRIIINLYPTNYYYMASEEAGFNTAVYSAIPVLFGQHPILRYVPGYNLQRASVSVNLLDNQIAGTWEIIIDYDTAPVDRIRNFFNVGELQNTVSSLSAEVLELQRDRKALSEEAERLSQQLVEEEKARRVYQVRAAQADAVARFLHQTSNLVLQPLASTMIVFEDFIDVIDDVRNELLPKLSDEELYRELDDSLARVKQTYPVASLVIDGYRELFLAFYEVYVSAETQRDINQDLRFIETLVKNKYILTNVELELELDPAVPKMKLEGGVQSIFLELLQNAAKQGAKRLLVRSEVDGDWVRFKIYNDGPPVREEERPTILERDVNEEGHGFGLADARYVVETLNGGILRLSASDRKPYTTLFEVALKVGDL